MEFCTSQFRRLWSVFAEAYSAEARELGIPFRRFSLPQFINFLIDPSAPLPPPVATDGTNTIRRSYRESIATHPSGNHPLGPRLACPLPARSPPRVVAAVLRPPLAAARSLPAGASAARPAFCPWMVSTPSTTSFAGIFQAPVALESWLPVPQESTVASVCLIALASNLASALAPAVNYSASNLLSSDACCSVDTQL